MNYFDPDPNVAILLAQGFNSFTQEPMATAIDPTSLTEPVGAGGQTVTYELQQIEDASSLRKLLNISASASLTGGIGGGTAKASFFSGLEISSYSSYIYLRVRVSNTSRALREYKMTDNAINFLKEFGINAFFENYGDEFVNGYTTGGELIAIIQINHRTVQEKTASEVSIQGSYGAFSGGGSFSAALEKINLTSATEIHIIRRGGTGPVPDVTTLKDMAINYPDTVKEETGNAVLLQLTTIPYALATNRPNNIYPLSLATQRGLLEHVSEQREAARVARADYRFAAEHPYFFFNPDVNALNAAVAACDIAINKINDSVRACLFQKGLNFIDPEATFPVIPLDWTIPLDVPLAVMVHEEGNGDTWGGAHQYVGTKGENRRIEGISIAISPPVPGLYIEYFVHAEGIGDMQAVRDGGFAGTRHQNRRIEGIQIRLLGPLAPLFDVVYMAHCEEVGDKQGQNDTYAGTRNLNLRCEGIMVSVTRK
ncbi:hypothetical protein [Undibacterium curvum]|uniref:hypothetical protein n=1 Tax=Undibacterium curvum TaxID=2762294 RepID=UPI003D15048C